MEKGKDEIIIEKKETREGEAKEERNGTWTKMEKGGRHRKVCKGNETVKIDEWKMY